jgi:TetR/AcrR family transcriptional regulator, ethionamide resistance regulator
VTRYAGTVSFSPRGGAPTAKRAQIQQDVLRATEELLAAGSYAELNVERIATSAGISRTAFYFYFADKREVLMRLAVAVVEEFYEQADIWWSGKEAERDLREALTNIASIYRQHGPLLRALVEVSTYDEEVAAFWRSLVDRFADATRRHIEAEQERGIAPPMPAAATAFALSWMAERTFYQVLAQGEEQVPDDIVEGLLGIFMRSVYGR